MPALPVRFDRYLSRMARSLTSEALTCRAVAPDVDGGLLFSVRAGSGDSHVVKMTYSQGEGFERPPRFSPGGAPAELVRDLEAIYLEFVGRHPHELSEFVGQDMEQMVLRKEVDLESVWSRHFRQGETRWGRYLLERLEPRNGALYLHFGADECKVKLRITDRLDPRLARAEKVLHVNQLALSLVTDDREPREQERLSAQVERFVAYLLAHTTGPATRIQGRAPAPPNVLLFGNDVEVNQFVPEGRQGASGMTACLTGEPRQRVKVLSFGDASCRQTFPSQSRLRFFDTWSYFPIRTAVTPGDWMVVDFSEREMVTGSEARLEQALAELKEKDPRPKVALLQTCVSRLIGDDLPGVLRSQLAEGDYVVLDPDFQSRQQGVDAVLWSWLFRSLRQQRWSEEKRAGLVNLVGFGGRSFPGNRELVELLGRFGMRVNAALFPSFTEEEMERFDAASITVASRCAIVQNAFAGVIAGDDRNKWVSPPCPFGVQGTGDWVRGILASAPGWEEQLADLDLLLLEKRAAMEEERAKADGQSMAFVSSSRYCSYLFDATETFGIPVLDMVSECGLGAEIFILQDGRIPRELEEKAGSMAGVELHIFTSRDELMRQLGGSSSRLLLTSIRRNHLPASLGKAPFYVHGFEMGLDGALRTARRLRQRCRFDLLHRYRSYLTA